MPSAIGEVRSRYLTGGLAVVVDAGGLEFTRCYAFERKVTRDRLPAVRAGNPAKSRDCAHG